MNPIILYRKSYELNMDSESVIAEESIVDKYFDITNFRSNIEEDSLVIGRYSVLPYYKELEDELLLSDSRLINSYEQHRYIADITQWYEDVKDYTPKTYTTWADLGDGKWIVKGKTSSRKHSWKTHMFADGRENLLKVIRLLHDDIAISEDGLVVREYVELKNLDTGINGLPITDEYRLFFYGNTFLAGGFYWSNFYDELKTKFDLSLKPDMIAFATEVAEIVSKKTNFFVLDIARKEDGSFVLIEINDGQMSGLSCVDANELYRNLSYELFKAGHTHKNFVDYSLDISSPAVIKKYHINEYIELYTIGRYLEELKYGNIVYDDGYGYAVKDGFMAPSTYIDPPDFDKNIPKDATHILWGFGSK